MSDASADEIDAHPLVREHFGARLKAERREAWRAGHGRLYEHLRDSSKQLPDILAEMAPLFQAMHHGCQAGRHQETLDYVYWARIQRGDQAYSSKKLGAIGAELAALAGMFDLPWDKPVGTLTQEDQAFILNEVAYNLRALGRLRQAVAPLRAGLELVTGRRRWENVARGAANLSELHLTLGEVVDAAATGETSVAHADRSGSDFIRVACRTTWANALHQAGEQTRAQALFEEAESLQVKWQPEYPRLYSVQGYRYCDLLLAQGRADDVRERVAQTLEWAVHGGGGLLSVALERLSLGRAALALGQHGEAAAQLDQAVEGQRRAGDIGYLPSALLARAALFRVTGDSERARHDLDEAARIAQRSEMRLFQCDVHLEYAWVALADRNHGKTREHVAEARRLVGETGYGRRRPEVEELEQTLRG